MTQDSFTRQQLIATLDDSAAEFLRLASSENEATMNIIPFEDSWTVSQLASHVTKSNKAIEQSLHMEGKTTGRDPAVRVQELKNIFLDFSTKFQSPDFIKPTLDHYQKESVIADYEKSAKLLNTTSGLVNVNEMISLPAFGEITKFELLHFVLYHTQRHIHQLKKILDKLNSKKINIHQKLNM